MAGNVKGKIPNWHYPPVPVPVQSLREFIAQHGQSVAVLTLWTKELGGYQFVTIGADRWHADAAVNLLNIITKALNLAPLKVLEDLRGDHPNVSLTLDQLNFLLWLLGYIYANTDTMDAGHKEYVQKYHDQLLPVLINANEKIVNKPV